MRIQLISKASKVIIALILLSNITNAQICNINRYIDSLYNINKTYNIEYQQAKPYGSFISTPYFLDIYEPENDSLELRPLIVFQFGGGYLIGDKLNPPADEYCSYWASRGYVCVSINYRLGFNTLNTGSAERAVYRGIQDLQAALRFLCENRDLYRIDTSNIIISGNSAGAVSSLHNAFMEQDQAPVSYMGFGFDFDSENLGGLYSSGNTYFNSQEVKSHGIIANWGGISDLNFIGDNPDDNIPTIMFHGNQDTLVHYSSGNPFGYSIFPVLYGSNPMSTMMENHNIPFCFKTFENTGHEPELLNNAYLDTILFMSRDFMYKNVLKPLIISFNGNQNPEINITETYEIFANEDISIGCININNGEITAINDNYFEVEWLSEGTDTMEVICYNSILAKDTINIPVSIENLNNIDPEILKTNQHFTPAILPNPCTDHIKIKANESIRQIIIINSKGKTQKFICNFSESNISIETSDLPVGIYSIQIYSKDSQCISNQKFLKL